MVTKKEFPKGTVILFISFIILIAIIFFNQKYSKKTIPQDLIAVLRPYAIPLQAFTLIDQNEQAFTEKNIKGKWSFLFFGYTHCPDVCPTTLSTLKQINNMLKKTPEAALNMQVIFVSVDPERDNPKMLGKYVTFFNPDFIAVTGQPNNLLKFTKQFAAAYIKEPTDTPGEYLMSHTSSIFLLNPEMKIVASFSPPHNAATITSQYIKIHDMF